MRVLIIAAGSMGDVAPYTGLGVRLRQAGHQVAIAAFEPFADLVRGCGLEFRALPGDPRQRQHSAENQRWQRGGGGALGASRLIRLLAEDMRRLGTAMVDVARQGADVLLLSGPAYMGGCDVAEGLGIPSIGVFAAPAHPTGSFPPPVGIPSLGSVGNRALGRLLCAGMSAAMSRGTTRLRADLGLPPRSFTATMRRQDAQHWPVYYGFSPSVLPRPADWRPGLEPVGYFWPQHAADWQPSAELRDFLEAGPAPVFVGFGSMVPAEARQLSELVTAALRRARVRGIVQSGWMGLAADGDDVCNVAEVPHEWLFGRMAAVVHHCGAGTTAATLRAGVPSVPVPVAVDQPFWASRLVELGVAPYVLPAKRLSVDALASAIRAAVRTPSYRERAGELARRIGAEDAAGRVVDAVNRLEGCG